MSYPNIAITAATGTLGTAIQDKFQKKNISYKALSRTKPMNIGDNDFISVDLLDLNELTNGFQNIETVFFNVPLSPDIEQMTQNIVRAASKNDVKRIMKFSVLNADADSDANLWKWHGLSEKIIANSGFDYLFLRSANFMQNFQNFYGESIRQDGAFYLPHGNARVNVIDIDDLADVVSELITLDKFETKMYQLTGHSYTKDEIASIFTNTLGRKITYVDVDEETAKESMLESGMPDWMVEVFLQFNKKCKEGYVDINTDHVRKILGRDPHDFSTYLLNNIYQF
ncbi:MAG: NmrA family NAD(P)-binding protein [Bacteroidetes bacterium]|jgi:uncharacterized protein YbjT (DUF2867 family)|nr:NmrA family NAD(P)-binding protein [Bacteroidota bacterium]